eukprot:jgi/Hompol1/1997/HPOL_002837-RA
MLQPHLGLEAKLSRSFANHIVLALLLVMCTLVMLSGTVSRQGDAAKRILVESCTGLEIAVNALALAPKFTAIAINRATTAEIRRAIAHASNVVALALTLVKQVLIYILFHYHRVMLCILQMGVSSAASAVTAHLQQASTFIDAQVQATSTAISDGLAAINAQIQSVNSQIDKLPSTPSIPFVGGGGPPIPHVPPAVLPGVSDKLAGFHLPTTYIDSLTSLSSKIPTLDDIESAVSAAISKPFDDLTSRFAALLSNVSVPDITVMPVPNTVDPIRFCYGDAYNLGWIDRLVEGVTVSLWYGCLGLALGMLGATAGYMFWTAYEHYIYERNISKLDDILDDASTQTLVSLTHDARRASIKDHDRSDKFTISRVMAATATRTRTVKPIETDLSFGSSGQSSMVGTDDKRSLQIQRLRFAVSAMHFPAWVALFEWISRRMKMPSIARSPAHIRTQWMMLYVAHPFSALCIMFGAAGLVAIRFQIFLLKLVLFRLIPFLAHEIALAAEFILRLISQAIDRVVGPYVDQINAQVTRVENDVNGVLVGWTNTTIDAVESAVGSVINGFSAAIHDVFASVPAVETAIVGFTTCVLGNGTTTLLRSIEAQLQSGIILDLPRINSTDFEMDVPKLASALGIVSNTMNISVDHTVPAAATLFYDQLAWLEAEYEQTLWMQMVPFWVALVFGCCVVFFGGVTVAVDTALYYLGLNSRSHQERSYHQNDSEDTASVRSAALGATQKMNPQL